jgi:predicted O-methyltransferase YrrM
MKASVQELFERCIDYTLSPTPRDSDWHLMTLFSLVLQNKSKNILELGVRYGDTTEPMIAAASLLGGKITCVDIENTLWRCPDDLQDIYTFVKVDAIRFLEEAVAKNEYYDFIYIDDWHTYPHVKRELELIDQIADEKTIIVLHDLMGNNCAPSYFYPLSLRDTEWDEGGPFRAVNELDLTKWEWVTLPVNNGLTILRKRSKIINY